MKDKPQKVVKFKVFANFSDGRGHVQAYKTLYNTRAEANVAASRVSRTNGHNPLVISTSGK